MMQQEKWVFVPPSPSKQERPVCLISNPAYDEQAWLFPSNEVSVAVLTEDYSVALKFNSPFQFEKI